MTPERWQKIGNVLQVAMEMQPAKRSAYLDSVCANDVSLRQEVESLLAANDRARESFLQNPPFLVAGAFDEGQESLVGRTIGNYRIIEMLGEGGMGQVYLAEDRKLNRKVAIKFLPVDLVAEVQAKRRLIREAQAAAALDHPNICVVHEVSEADDRSFIVMEYVEGETLDVRMKRKSLEFSESLTIAAQVADALAEAHAHGIIHRDIKPSNIIITPRGQAKVMDFGLAKLAGGADEAEAETQSFLTTPGTILGTVPYMSPEQVKGQPVDARSDIFGFGVVFYEMLTGQQPFAAESTAGTISAILMKEPAPLASYIAHCPEELQRIMRKCLEKDRERRYQTMRDLALDLDNCCRGLKAAREVGPKGELAPKDEAVRMLPDNVSDRLQIPSRRALVGGAALVLLVGVALVYVFAFHRTNTTAPPPTIKSLAVLPLENLSGDPTQEYFADGMTEALISNLAQLRALKVISRTSVMHYKGSNKSLPEIARELNVDAVIEGSVQRSGGRVKVTAQLIHGATDAHLWAHDYERDLTDVLKLESEVARAIAAEIRIQVTAEERGRLASARGINPQAHEAYLRGRYHLARRNEDDLKLAIDYFERAIQLAPDYAAAYAGLSDAWGERGIWGRKTFKEVEKPRRDAALKAIELDPTSAEAHISLSGVKFAYDWDWSGAEQEAKRAMEIDPGSLDAHDSYANLLMALGRHDEAIGQMQTAEQLDPFSSLVQSNFGRVLYRARRYEEAVTHLKRAGELDPQNYGALGRLGDAYAHMSKFKEAIASFEKAGNLSGDENYRARIARVYAMMGKQHEAREMIGSLKARPFEIAGVYAILGDKNQAFKILEKAIEERDSLLVFLKEDPDFDSLHSDPRWKNFLRQMNFPGE